MSDLYDVPERALQPAEPPPMSDDERASIEARVLECSSFWWGKYVEDDDRYTISEAVRIAFKLPCASAEERWKTVERALREVAAECAERFE